MEHLFTFWEGPMPAYIKMCIETWRGPYKQTFLAYENLNDYTNIDIDKLKSSGLTLPQIADYIRVHVLRDNGGYWLDADTIMLSDKLPEENMIGNPNSRTNTIGFLHTEPRSAMYNAWAEYQDYTLDKHLNVYTWNAMGNAFTDRYVREHEDITIAPVAMCWPETYKIQGTEPRNVKYRRFYFEQDKHLHELLPTDMLMLHNSWTPEWYKALSMDRMLSHKCTMSNILKEVLCDSL